MDNNYFGNICYCRKCNGIVHTIKKGDSLYLLSRYYNVPIGEIMNANRHLNIYNLQIGEEICIPIRRSDMLNDNVNNNMSNNNMINGNMPNNNIADSGMTNGGAANGMLNGGMVSSDMPNNNPGMSNAVPNFGMPDNSIPNNLPDSEMNNNLPDMNSITGGMPGIQIPANDSLSGTSFDEACYDRMEASCVSCSGETFDKNIKMSELISQEDMTFEKFLSLIQN